MQERVLRTSTSDVSYVYQIRLQSVEKKELWQTFAPRVSKSLRTVKRAAQKLKYQHSLTTLYIKFDCSLCKTREEVLFTNLHTTLHAC